MDKEEFSGKPDWGHFVEKAKVFETECPDATISHAYLRGAESMMGACVQVSAQFEAMRWKIQMQSETIKALVKQVGDLERANRGAEA